MNFFSDLIVVPKAVIVCKFNVFVIVRFEVSVPLVLFSFPSAHASKVLSEFVPMTASPLVSGYAHLRASSHAPASRSLKPSIITEQLLEH